MHVRMCAIFQLYDMCLTPIDPIKLTFLRTFNNLPLSDTGLTSSVEL